MSVVGRGQRAVFATIHRVSSLQARVLSSSPSAVVWKPSKAAEKEITEKYKRLDLNFENGKEAFKSKTNSELLRAAVVLRMCSIEILVKNNTIILKIMRKLFGDKLFKEVLKRSFYGQFVAGEDKNEVAPTVAKMQKFGVKSIFDYSVEKDITREEAQKKAFERVDETAIVSTSPLRQVVDDQVVARTSRKYNVYKEFADRRQHVVSARTYFYDGEEECDRNRDIFCDSIDAVASTTGGHGFGAIKVTALGRPALLLKASESIAQTQNFFKAVTGSTWENLVLSKLSEQEFLQKLQEYGVKTDCKIVQEWFKSVDFDSDGFVDFYDWSELFDENKKLSQMFQVFNIKTQKIEPLITELSDEEEQEFANMVDRVVHIVDYAISKGVRIMIDAEQTYFQPAISRITTALMRKHNKDGGWVFNTYQAYLKGCMRDIELDMHIARRGNFHFGCKLVRGAYMDQERQRAATIGYEDPVNPNLEATAAMYNNVLARIVDERDVRGPGKVSVMVASHNEESTRYAVQLMKDKCIAPSEKMICFAQLLGMCDQISFSLGQAGYSVYKYVPYGPIDGVLPYLSRRAQENGGLLLKSHKERKLLINELVRRLGNGQVFYKVPEPLPEPLTETL